MSESTDAGKTYRKVEEPQGDTSIAIVEEAMRLGPGASNPDIAQAVDENHDIDTSPSWVSRVRNKHLEVEENTGEDTTDAADEDDAEDDADEDDEPDQSGVDDFDPNADVDFPRGGEADGAEPAEDRPASLASIVDEVVDQYTERVEADVESLETNVAELRRTVERLVDAIERDTYPTSLSDYPEDVQKELRADALEAELSELRGE